MARNLIPIDKVRASRDGHEFHEIWAARKAFQLLIPTDNLKGIAVEGPEPDDQASAAPETIEIADLVLYYGRATTLKGADTVRIIQLKLSISGVDVDFRVSHAKKTIIKFAKAYLDYKKRYSAKEVRDKLEFELITNRPIYPAFELAIASIANGKHLVGEVKKQADQFKAACGLDGRLLVEFASKCLLTGLAGSLSDTKRDLSRTLVDWTASNDAVAGARLGAVRQLVRDKAGYAGTNKNVIRRTDVLAALDISDVDELLPCPESLPKIGDVVEREQLAAAFEIIPKLDKPLLIHASGGVGKTVFLDSLARALSDKHEVVFFDCFGGGTYRAWDDSRHLPKNGLVHIINTLAFRSLCDPLLPGNGDVALLFRAFRRRISQCVKTLSTASKDRQIILFIDAIDNAAVHAADRNEVSFPTELLESFHHNASVPGLKLVVSCRTERIEISTKDVPYHDFRLEPFSLSETGTYLRDRLPNVTQAEIQVAQARSGGNARILEHLVTSDRGLLDQSEIESVIELDDLLTKRIEVALAEAVRRGYKKAETNAFLAGLSILPPPVPLDEYAGAHGMDISAIESFAADLAPLLERTKHGLMFRDEPTETLIREKFGSNDIALQRVAKKLLNRQDSSVYAARALPGLLQKLDDGKQLFKLAFDERFPETITSTVGKRNIRYARLKAAVLHAANKQNHNWLVRLLVELSTIAAVDQKGGDYILDYPDLVIAAQDVDATRRLFETRSNWPGTRHARLAIANTLSGDLDEAYRHAVRADEWIFHFRQQDSKHDIDRSGPERLDIASIPFCLITQNRFKNAIGFMRGWKHWYAYEVGEHLFGLVEQLKLVKSPSEYDVSGFLDNTTDNIGVIASALSFLNLDDTHRCLLIKKLSKACKKEKKLETVDDFHRKANYSLNDGLLKASVIAVSLGLGTDVLTICRHMQQERPSIWSFQDHYSSKYVFPFLAHAALISAIKGNVLRERDILPKELYEIYSSVRNAGSGAEFREKLKKRMESPFQSNKDKSGKDKKPISYQLKSNAEHFLHDKLEPLLTLVNSFAGLIGSPVKKGDKAFLALLEVWAESRRKSDRYSNKKFNSFFQLLGCKLAVFALWARTDLKATSVKMFLKLLHEQEILDVPTVIEVVAILAKRSHLHSLAGEQAVKISSMIGHEYEVSSRANFYAELSRAILLASRDEAAEYFKAGLEQMDAIGSGDLEFTNELLLFASSLRGDELVEQDFHTLTNICELNMSYDAEKFPWIAFAKGLSRTSGCKTIAKMARWDDRSKISLNYTLQPYLIALIDDGKIEPEYALALNRLSNPVEFLNCNTADFAQAIYDKNYPNLAPLVSDLIQQSEDNCQGIPMDSTVKTLSLIATKVLGEESMITAYLSDAHKHFAKVRQELNENMNYYGESDHQVSLKEINKKKQSQTKLRKLTAKTTPVDEVSMGEAIGELNEIQDIYAFKEDFFNNLRSKVSYAARPKYIQILSRLENLDIYTKLRELEKCKKEWEKSAMALASPFKALGVTIVQMHADDFISYGQLSGYQLKEVSDLSGVPMTMLAQELIKVFALPESFVPSSVWLRLASFICDEADDGEGQSALARLLNSNSAKLASNVTDGKWKDGLYPVNNITEISSGIIWRMLGSPAASNRWLAAHSVRCLAKFNKWEVIDALVAKYSKEDSYPFQAPELRFYYMHARLWLLIALARIALDYPKKVAKYHKVLMKVALDEDSPHVLLRHFASRAILTCADSGNLKLSARSKKRIRAINLSPFPLLKTKDGRSRSYYYDRPEGVPEPKLEFHLDYDFNKYYVDDLCNIFRKPGWEVKDLIAKEVHKYDQEITSMYDNGGREENRSHRFEGLTSKFHGYGQYLGWHALYLVAGRLLKKYPATDSWIYDDPWPEWLNRHLLTRQDGLWLSDGVDRPPLAVNTNLLEKGKDSLILTGSKTKMLSLVGIDSSLGQGTVVEGYWTSPDNINVNISSAWVVTRKAKALAKQLVQEKPFFVWLPTYEKGEEDHEYIRNDKDGYDPWIVCPQVEARFDEKDPLGAICAERRPRFTKNIIKDFSIMTNDPFSRIWRKSTGKQVAHSDAWVHEREGTSMGTRLICSDQFLKELLAKRDEDLLVLIKLQRYEKGIGDRDSRFSNTIAVVRIKKTLDYEYYKGVINQVQQSRF